MKISVKIVGALVLLFSIVSATGCLRSKFPVETTKKDVVVSLTAKNDQSEVLDGSVGDVVLFVFDADNKFLRRIDTNIGSTISLSQIASPSITIVGLGNARVSKIVLPELASQHKLSDLIVSAAQIASRSGVAEGSRANVIDGSPSDLFWGLKTITLANQSTSVVVDLHPIVGTMKIAVTALKSYPTPAVGEYSIVLSSVHHSINHEGKAAGTADKLGVAAAFDAADIFTTAKFNLFAQPQGVVVEIYRGNTLLEVIDKDAAGNKFIVEAGKNLNINIALDATIGVSTSVEPWVPTEIIKDNL